MKLLEFTQSDAAKIEPGIIRGVRILGLKSKNKREYTPAALEKAKSLYEQASVFVDHKGGSPRKAEERFGTIQNVTADAKGLVGDLKFLESHPMAGRVAEDVARDLRLFGLSHDAEGAGKKNDKGVLIVESIDKVNSVDLVTGAATVTSLLESIQTDADDPYTADHVVSLSEQVQTLQEQLAAAQEAHKAEVAKLTEQVAKLSQKRYIRPISTVPLTEQTLSDPKAVAKFLTTP